MCVDNCAGPCQGIQQVEKDILTEEGCRGSGESSHTSWSPAPTPPHTPLSSMAPESMESMESIFEPRPFPPASLAGVPVEYIMDQLHSLAPGYWDHPETADCTILIPVPHYRQWSWFSLENAHLAGPPPAYESAGRRASAPCSGAIPQITMNLHTDYLFAHSTFLRALFSEASSLNLINSSEATAATAPGASTSLSTPSGNYTVPPDRLPRLMPKSTPGHPVLYLPVPDPTSVHLLVHWMYFGDTALIRDALDKRVIQWEGIARNVEYLGLPSEIKVFLGRWYGSWLQTQSPDATCDTAGAGGSDGDDSDTAFSSDDDMMDDSESESESEAESDTDSAETDMDVSMAVDSLKEDFEPSRGRDRATRCLSWTHTEASAFTSLSALAESSAVYPPPVSAPSPA